MARTGPVTKDTSTVALGLAQVRLGPSAANIGVTTPVLTADNSIGALASTTFKAEAEFWELYSGFPQMKDMTVPLKTGASMEVAFKEISPKNLAWALGKDASTGYTAAHSGEIALGSLVAPEFVRMEAVYTFPNGTNAMTIVFPRAQVKSSLEMELQSEDAAEVPVTIESTRADSEVSGGNVAWDAKPLGAFIFT